MVAMTETASVNAIELRGDREELWRRASAGRRDAYREARVDLRPRGPERGGKIYPHQDSGRLTSDAGGI
jgi:hypothetical protein